jgi:hypothetical protein
MLVDAATAKRLKLGKSRVVGTAAESLGTAPARLTIRFDKRVAKKLRRARKLRLTINAVVKDAAGNARPVSARVTLKR